MFLSIVFLLLFSMIKWISILFYFVITLSQEEDLNLLENDPIDKLIGENLDQNIAIFGVTISTEFYDVFSLKFAGLFWTSRLKTKSSKIPDDGFLISPIGNADLRRNNYLIKSYSEFDLVEILNFLELFVHGNFTVVNSTDFLNKLYEFIVKRIKIPVILIDPESTKRNLVFKSISMRNLFQKDFEFFKYEGSKEALLEILKVDRFPELECFFPHTMKTDIGYNFDFKNVRIGSWSLNKPLVYNNMFRFLNELRESELISDFFSDRELFAADNRPAEEIKSDYNEMLSDYYLTNKNILQICERVQCFLIVEKLHEISSQSFADLNELMRKLQNEFKYNQTKFILMDASCHSQLTKLFQFNDRTFPIVVSYDAKTSHLAFFNGKLDLNILKDWVNNVLQGIVEKFFVNISLKIIRNECAKYSEEAMKRYRETLSQPVISEL